MEDGATDGESKSRPYELLSWWLIITSGCVTMIITGIFGLVGLSKFSVLVWDSMHDEIFL